MNALWGGRKICLIVGVCVISLTLGNEKLTINKLMKECE
jgi:hypothetical protein